MSRQTRVDEVVEFILAGIASGRFPIGERLPGEDALAQLADASRLTLREAVSILATQQVLNPVQGRGTFINDPNQWLSPAALLRVQKGSPLDALLQMVDVRALLEIGAAERFASVATDEQVAALRMQLDEMIEADEQVDVDRVMRADLAFHQVIIAGSGNPFIGAAMAPLSHVLAEARRATSGIPQMRSHAIVEHTNVLRAVEQRDPDAAQRAMRSHMRQTADDIRQHFSRQRPDLLGVSPL